MVRAGHHGGEEVRAALCDLPVLHALLALVGRGAPLMRTGTRFGAYIHSMARALGATVHFIATALGPPVHFVLHTLLDVM